MIANAFLKHDEEYRKFTQQTCNPDSIQVPDDTCDRLTEVHFQLTDRTKLQKLKTDLDRQRQQSERSTALLDIEVKALLNVQSSNRAAGSHGRVRVARSVQRRLEPADANSALIMGRNVSNRWNASVDNLVRLNPLLFEGTLNGTSGNLTGLQGLGTHMLQCGGLQLIPCVLQKQTMGAHILLFTPAPRSFAVIYTLVEPLI